MDNLWTLPAASEWDLTGFRMWWNPFCWLCSEPQWLPMCMCLRVRNSERKDNRNSYKTSLVRGWGFVGNDADRRSLICIAEATGNPLLICFIKSMVSLWKTILLRGIVTQQEGHQDGIDTVRKFLILMQIGKRCKKGRPARYFYRAAVLLLYRMLRPSLLGCYP